MIVFVWFPVSALYIIGIFLEDGQVCHFSNFDADDKVYESGDILELPRRGKQENCTVVLLGIHGMVIVVMVSQLQIEYVYCVDTVMNGYYRKPGPGSCQSKKLFRSNLQVGRCWCDRPKQLEHIWAQHFCHRGGDVTDCCV